MSMSQSFIKVVAFFLCVFSYIHSVNAQSVTQQESVIVEPKDSKVEVVKSAKFTYSHTFYREKKKTGKDGKIEITREIAKQTLPGEKLVGVATYLYTGQEPAEDIVFTLPLPKEVIYVKGSATDEKYVWFSVDNGKSWQRFRQLRIVEPDGTKRIATANDITHLQWRMANKLKKGDKGSLEYKIIIR